VFLNCPTLTTKESNKISLLIPPLKLRSHTIFAQCLHYFMHFIFSSSYPTDILQYLCVAFSVKVLPSFLMVCRWICPNIYRSIAWENGWRGLSVIRSIVLWFPWHPDYCLPCTVDPVKLSTTLQLFGHSGRYAAFSTFSTKILLWLLMSKYVTVILGTETCRQPSPSTPQFHVQRRSSNVMSVF